MDNSLIIKENYTDPIEEMKDLIVWLNETTKLYNEGCPIVSDRRWDDKYYRLVQLEKETNTILPESPTQSIYFEIRDYLPKIKHEHLMLSLDKTKDLKVIESFLGNRAWVAMGKMDGLTCSLTYENGELIRAETRGNGEEGEDILHNAKANLSIPNHIPYKNRVVIDGEIICTYTEFEKIKDQYKNPRNYAAGSIRLLDSHESRDRFLTFVAWDVIELIDLEGDLVKSNLVNQLQEIEQYGFNIVPYVDKSDNFTVEDAITTVKGLCDIMKYPIDGIVFKFNDLNLRDSLGNTAHHFNNAIAFKFFDDLYDTRLKYISWTMGRTGVLTPVAVFDPIDMDGSIVERASLHNVSVMREILGSCAYVGEPLKVYKANQIIPQIAEAGPKYDYGYVISHGGVSANDAPEVCPICGGPVTIRNNDGIETLECINLLCQGKLVNRMDHYLGKKGIDAKGISKATLQKLFDWDWVYNLCDLYTLEEYAEEWKKKEGFGEKSVTNILNSIKEASTNVPLEKFISAIGIPMVGETIAKQLVHKFPTYQDFRNAIENKYEFYKLPGFGPALDLAISEFDYSEADELAENYITFAAPVNNIAGSAVAGILAGVTFAITGSLTTYKNRPELQSKIESLGGKVTSAVSKNTSYLINNKPDSTSSKNLTARKLSVPIITEAQFNEMIG